MLVLYRVHGVDSTALMIIMNQGTGNGREGEAEPQNGGRRDLRHGLIKSDLPAVKVKVRSISTRSPVHARPR